MTDECPRVVVAVSPRLLGDLVVRVMALAGYDVVDVDLVARECEPTPVAVVSPGRETHVAADVVLTLPREGSHDALLHQEGRDRVVTMAGLTDLSRLVSSLGGAPA